jgi:mRNA-degrading endonuclease toxin of MazEF toxin-antitoxin module
MPYEPGRILLVAYPFTDRTAAKQRPVMVISALEFNQGEDVVVLPMSSRVVSDDPYGFPILSTEPYFPQTRLRQSSIVKWSKPMTISSRVIVRKLGVVPEEVLEQIRERTRSVLR